MKYNNNNNNDNLCAILNLIKKVSTFNLLNKLTRIQVGTNEVEIACAKIVGQLQRKVSKRKLVVESMKLKRLTTKMRSR